MGIFDIFKKKNINEGLRAFKSEARALLIDVRSRDEYAKGHISRSKNIPLNEIVKAESSIADKDMPIYPYCESGGRCKKALKQLQKAGYTTVYEIGGIDTYTGKLEKGTGRSKNPMSNISADRMRKSEPWNKNLKIR